MTDICKTVMITTANGPVRINHADFDAKVHTLHEGEILPPNPPASNNGGASNTNVEGSGNDGDGDSNADIKFGVMQKKKKHYVVDQATNNVVTGVDGIDANGYPDNASAWNAVLALQTPAA